MAIELEILDEKSKQALREVIAFVRRSSRNDLKGRDRTRSSFNPPVHVVTATTTGDIPAMTAATTAANAIVGQGYMSVRTFAATTASTSVTITNTTFRKPVVNLGTAALTTGVDHVAYQHMLTGRWIIPPGPSAQVYFARPHYDSPGYNTEGTALIYASTNVTFGAIAATTVGTTFSEYTVVSKLGSGTTPASGSELAVWNMSDMPLSTDGTIGRYMPMIQARASDSPDAPDGNTWMWLSNLPDIRFKQYEFINFGAVTSNSSATWTSSFIRGDVVSGFTVTSSSAETERTFEITYDATGKAWAKIISYGRWTFACNAHVSSSSTGTSDFEVAIITAASSSLAFGGTGGIGTHEFSVGVDTGQHQSVSFVGSGRWTWGDVPAFFTVGIRRANGTGTASLDDFRLIVKRGD